MSSKNAYVFMYFPLSVICLVKSIKVDWIVLQECCFIFERLSKELLEDYGLTYSCSCKISIMSSLLEDMEGHEQSHL